jgi:hypothetical protein
MLKALRANGVVKLYIRKVSLMFGILSVYGIDMNSPKYENFE